MLSHLIKNPIANTGGVIHLKEWNHQIENEPNVDHLDVGSLGQVLRDGDEHGCQHQHHRQVDRDHLDSNFCFLSTGIGLTASKKKGLK